jgi:hypothetical protein
MAAIKDVVIYICNNWRKKDNPLSIEKLEWIIFLCDWKSVLVYQKQITDIEWIATNSGPSTNEIINFVGQFVSDHYRNVEVENIAGSFGSMRTVISFKKDFRVDLSQKDKSIIDFILHKASKMTNLEFTRLVQSTYPIIANDQVDKLNLVKLAGEYEKIPA